MKKSSVPIIMIILLNFLYSQSLGPQASAYHSIGLSSNGMVYTWGRNSSGQLGNNSTVQENAPINVQKGAYSGSTYLGDDSNNKIVGVSLGYFHSIALAQDGTVYSWGSNTNGKLGDNSTTPSNIPVQVVMGSYSGTTYLGDNTNNKIIAVALGADHSMALDESGLVYTWGYNGAWQLGDGTYSTYAITPVIVVDGAYNGTSYLGDNSSNKIIAIAGGYDHSIALAEDGTVFTWGGNGSGQLGNNSTSQSNVPVAVVKGTYDGTTYLGDNESNKMVKIASGRYFSAALAEDGTVYTWGENGYGQLGNNSTTDSDVPVHVIMGSYSGTTYLGDNASNKIVNIALGNYHAVALAEDGTVYTWGRNSYGQLGNASTTQSNYPVKVLMGSYSGTTYLGDNASNKIVDIALGYYHSLALAQDGTVYTWGHNDYGELGDNSTTQSTVPVQVTDIGGTGELALPITLTTFTAKINSGKIVLKWHTESQTNNSHFHIYRNGENIARIEGAGTTTESNDYTFVDENVLSGIGYTYTLSDVDYGNNETIYDKKSVTVVMNETNSEKDFKIIDIYPNPFNPSTTIEFKLHVSSDIQIHVFDQKGNLIKTLLDQYVNKGNYDIEFDGSELSSGIYFVRLNADNYAECKKILLLK